MAMTDFEAHWSQFISRATTLSYCPQIKLPFKISEVLHCLPFSPMKTTAGCPHRGTICSTVDYDTNAMTTNDNCMPNVVFQSPQLTMTLYAAFC